MASLSDGVVVDSALRQPNPLSLSVAVISCDGLGFLSDAPIVERRCGSNELVEEGLMKRCEAKKVCFLSCDKKQSELNLVHAQ